MSVPDPLVHDGGQWPADPEVLVDTTRCPACFTEITASPCTACGLDLLDSRTFALLNLSRGVKELVEQRTEVIRAIRLDQHAAQLANEREGERRRQAEQTGREVSDSAVAEPLVEQDAASQPVEDSHAAASPSAASAPTLPPPAASAEAGPVAGVPSRGGRLPIETEDEPKRPRRSGVQVFLLTVGVVLLAVAAVFFLTVAWISGGLVLRSAVVGLGTVGVIGTASVLRRRGLGATAEGIAALGVSLVALDAWAVRANDLGGTGAVDPRVYWGGSLLIAALGFVAWGWVSRLRVPGLAGIATMAVAPGLLAAGALGAEGAFGLYVFALPAVAVALARRPVGALATRAGAGATLEKNFLLAVGATATVLAVVGLLQLPPGQPWAPLWAAVPLVLLLALHAVVLGLEGEADLAPLAAVLAVLALVAAIGMVAVRLVEPLFTATVPLLACTLLALVLEYAASRSGEGITRRSVTWAAVGAAAATGAAAVPSLLWAAGALGGPLGSITRPWRAGAFDTFVPDATSGAAIIALAVVVAMAGAAWGLTNRWTARREPWLWGAAVVLLVVGPQLRINIFVVVWYLVIAGGAVIFLRRRDGRVPNPVALTALVVAAPLAYAVSFASAPGWAMASLGLAVLLFAVRELRPQIGRILVPALVLFAVTTAALLPLALEVSTGAVMGGLDPAVAATAVAAMLLAVFVAPVTRVFDDPQREAGTLTSAAIVLIGLLPPAVVGTSAPSEWWLASTSAVAVTAALIGVHGRWNAAWEITRPLLAVLVAPCLAVLAVLACRLADAPALALAVAPLVAATLVIALALAAARREPGIRVAYEGGAAAVAVVGVVATPDHLWLPLLLAGAAALLAAVSPDGLFVSTSGRRHLVWLALGLATAGLWLRLFDGSVETVEPYTLPVAAVLVLMAVLTERARRRAAGRTVTAPAVILFAGAALALVPSAAARSNDLTASIVIGTLAAAVLIAGAWIRLPRTPDLLPVAVASAGAAGVVTILGGTVGMHAGSLSGRALGWDPDAFVIAGAAGLLAAGVGVARRESPWAARAGQTAIVVGIAVLAFGQSVLLAAADGPLVRSILTAVLLAVIATGCLALSRAPFGVIPAATALVGGAVIAAVTVGAGIRPLEWGTVPFALALLASAAVDRNPGTVQRAPVLWGSGLAVALVPLAFLSGESASLLRPVFAVGVGGILLLAAAAAAPLPRRLAAFRLPTILVTAPAVIVAVLVRVTADLDPTLLQGWSAFDAWMLAGTVPVGLAGLLLARRYGSDAPAPTATADTALERVAPWLLVAALTLVAGLSSLALAVTEGSWLRAAATVTGLAAVGAAAGLARRTPPWPLVARSANALAAAVALVAVVLGSVRPVEAVTVPLAISLLIVGVRMLRSDSTLSSWRTIAPGLGLLLCPSLLYDFGDNDLWRAIALGAASLGVLLAGVRWRLQAPVLLGGGVLLVHAIAQLWPWVAALYEAASGLWWLWLGIAGVVLIAIAATYERRIRELRAVALAIRSLR